MVCLKFADQDTESASSVSDILRHMGEALSEEQWGAFVGMLWSLWRVRNDLVYGGKKLCIIRLQLYARAIHTETIISNAGKAHTTQAQRQQASFGSEVTCYIDGSWLTGWNGGIGYVFFENEEMKLYHSAAARVCCPLQAEAHALLEAIRKAKQMGVTKCEFFTDSLELHQLCTQYMPPTNGDWRACQEIFQSWIMLKEIENFQCSHLLRDCNGIADELAKKGRMEGWVLTGCTFPLFIPTKRDSG